MNNAGFTNTEPKPLISNTAYANMLDSPNNDKQSIISEMGSPYIGGYIGAQHINSVMGSQNSLTHAKDASGASTAPAQNHEEGPQPTPEDFKKAWTLETLSDSMSLLYAISLVSIGFVIYLADTVKGSNAAIAESFNIYLIVVQFCWLVFVHADVRLYLKSIKKAMGEAKENGNDNNDEGGLESTDDGQHQLPTKSSRRKKTISQDYGFTSGRHGGSLYLKIGATGIWTPYPI